MALVTASCKALLTKLMDMGSAHDAACDSCAADFSHVLEAIADQKVTLSIFLSSDFAVSPNLDLNLLHRILVFALLTSKIQLVGTGIFYPIY